MIDKTNFGDPEHSKNRYRWVPAWVLLLVGLYFTSLYSYLLFHSLAEFFSIAISLAIFLFAWNTRKLLDHDYLVFLGIAYLFIGLLDLVHTLAYKGMGIFPGYGSNLPTQLWIAARYLESISLFAAPLFLGRRIKTALYIPGFGTATLLILVSIFYWSVFPNCFIEGLGLTSFKKTSEYIIILILLGAMVFHYRRRPAFDEEVFRLLLASIFLTICAELAFTFYINVYGLSNLVGHYFKILSFYLIYRAIIATGLTKPYTLLFRKLLRQQEELVQARDQLELRVGERTEELVAANRKLRQEMAAREKAQQELAKSEKRLQAIIRAAEDVSFILIDLAAEPKPEIIEFSTGAEKLFGCRREETIGRTLDGFYAPDEVKRLPAFIELLRRGEKGFEGELNMVRRNGEIFPAYVSFTPVINSFNGPTALGVSVDLSRIKQMEAELRKWIQVFTLAEWGICVGSVDNSNLEMMNPAFARMHGYSVEEITGRPIADLFAPESRMAGKKSLKSAYEKNHHVFEIPHIRRDGSVFPVQHDVTTITDKQGGRFRIMNLQDITPRKQAEEQLRKSKDEWERTFDAIGDIAIIVDNDFRIVRINQQGHLILADKTGDPLGRHCYQVFREATQPCEGCPVLLARQDKAAHISEMHHKHLRKIFQVSASPVVNAEGEVTSVVYFAKDITEQKNLEMRLNQAQKMEAIGTLAGGIAHDFNNILSPILGYAELVLEDLPPDSSAAADIKQIVSGAYRAKELVKQILSFSRQAEHETRPLKIQYVLKEAIKLLRATIPATIEIKQDIDPSCGSVMADPSQLHQIIMNLCTNAFHAMRDTGGIMHIALEPVTIDPHDVRTLLKLKAGNYIRLEVSDTGHGMVPEIIEKIFEPYFTTKGKGEGTGLGLAVVHGIVENLGGDITVYSELEQGTTFHVYFPMPAEYAETTEDEPKAEPYPTGNERILVVDDEEELVTMEKRMLTSLGYTVTTCTSSRKCLEIFKSGPRDFDLLITDMNMPEMTGDILTREILAVRPDLPVVLLTGFSERISEERAGSYGIRKFVMKPIIKRNLAQIVRQVLDNDKN